MPNAVDFELKCSEADRARARAAEALFQAICDGSAPTELPPELVGVFVDVGEFEVVFCEFPESLGAQFHEDGEYLCFDDEDAEIERLVDFIQILCPDALPVTIHWIAEGVDGRAGGRVTVCRDEERWLGPWATEESVYGRTQREAAE